MSAPGPFDVATQLGVVKFLSDKLTAARKEDLGPQATSALPVGTRLPVMVGGEHIGWLSIPQPRTTATVADPAKFLAWAREHAPTEIVEAVRESFTRNVLESVKARGGWLDKATGEVVEVPGVTVSQGDPYPKVDLADGAGDAIGKAWRAGQIDLGQMLALPPAEGGEAA